VACLEYKLCSSVVNSTVFVLIKMYPDYRQMENLEISTVGSYGLLANIQTWLNCCLFCFVCSAFTVQCYAGTQLNCPYFYPYL